MVVRAVVFNAIWAALIGALVGMIVGATGSRLIQYAVLGVLVGMAIQLIAIHSFPEAALRPVRVALTGHMGIGDSLPRSHPTFAAWSNISMLAVAFAFALAGGFLSAA